MTVQIRKKRFESYNQVWLSAVGGLGRGSDYDDDGMVRVGRGGSMDGLYRANSYDLTPGLAREPGGDYMVGEGEAFDHDDVVNIGRAGSHGGHEEKHGDARRSYDYNAMGMRGPGPRGGGGYDDEGDESGSYEDYAPPSRYK